LFTSGRPARKTRITLDLTGTFVKLGKLYGILTAGHVLEKLGAESLPERPVNDPVTREEFERAIEDLARFIKARKRMEFWAKLDGDERKWVSRPERLAQNLLDSFSQARFRENVEMFDELAAGAGRIDLYVKLSGGLAIIIGLKMCGSPGYSAAYAASGEEQIIHYMDNKDSHLG
jgi:hypothetical protein